MQAVESTLLISLRALIFDVSLDVSVAHFSDYSNGARPITVLFFVHSRLVV